jgi:hypothetical protein
MTAYFCYEYYNFLVTNRLVTADESSNENNYYKLDNTDTPVFVFIFDELSSYLVLNKEGYIDEGLFPELKEFSMTSTWYPNATTQISDTLVSRSNIFSGHNYFKDCKEKSKFCVNDITHGLMKGKYPVNNLLKLNGINSKVNHMDKWHSVNKASDNQRYRTTGKNIKRYINVLIDIYLLAVLTPNWSSRLKATNEQLYLRTSEFAKGAILEGLPESYGFLKCASLSERSVQRFNLFIDRINPDDYLINSILTNLTHTPFCYDENGLVEVVYPIRKVSDGNGNHKYVPDAVSMDDYVLSSCTHDEISYNVRRARINQTKLALKLFNKGLKKIKDLGIFDKSLIIVMSDHGVGFLGPSFGRGNHKQRNKEDTLDNRMMNASIVLMVKHPYQRRPEIDDRMARPIDVGATLIDFLKVKPPWRVDGQSLLSDDWNHITPPLEFHQLLYKEGEWANNVKIWAGGEIIKPTDYFYEINKRANIVNIYKSRWIGGDVNELPLKNQRTGKLEYLKIEKALPTENKGDYVLTLGGYSFDPDLNPSALTYIAVNNTIIKSTKPCLSFRYGQHKRGDILGGWVVNIPRDVINSKNLRIRAFSPVENSDEESFYELENPINIELTDKQFQKVGNKI